MMRSLILFVMLFVAGGPCLAQLPTRPSTAPQSAQPPAASAPTLPEVKALPTAPFQPQPSKEAEPPKPAIVTLPPPPSQSSSPTPSAAGPVAGLSYPGIISLLAARKFAEVPDDVAGRRHIFSLLAGITQVCGERSRPVVEASGGYIDPRVAINGDMVQGGAQIFLEVLSGMKNTLESGRMGPLLNTLDPSVHLTGEGQEDGALLAARLGCVSKEFRDIEARINELVIAKSGTPFGPGDALMFQSLASPEFRERHVIPDPGPRLRERRILASQGKAKQQCVKRYEPAAFCDCLLTGLQAANLEEGQWASVGADFDKVVDVARQRPPIAQTIRGCTRS